MLLAKHFLRGQVESLLDARMPRYLCPIQVDYKSAAG